MNLNDIIHREMPAPWSEGDNIPWYDVAFSRRMLAVHLSQENDLASRRFELIDRHVAFLHQVLLDGQPSCVLDLGCGPGLYATRLARLGHRVRGIDFSPASIEYARETSAREQLDCGFELADLRQADYGQDYDMAMLLYGEFNVFAPPDIERILRKAQAALKPGGRLVLEPSPEGHIRAMGKEAVSWFTAQQSIFSAEPHILLNESFWDESSRAATNRYYIIDEGGRVTRLAASYQAYTDNDLEMLLTDCGFGAIRFWPNLSGSGERAEDFIVVTAERV